MKIYRNLWIGAGGSPTARVKAAISIPAGKRKVIRVNCFAEGLVSRLYVKQATGTGIGFSVYLLSSALPYGDAVADNALVAYNAATAADPDLFAIIDKQTATSGNAVNFRDPVGNQGHSFINDDMPKFTKSDEYRFCYLVIIPANAQDTTTWEVALTVSEVVGS